MPTSAEMNSEHDMRALGAAIIANAYKALAERQWEISQAGWNQEHVRARRWFDDPDYGVISLRLAAEVAEVDLAQCQAAARWILKGLESEGVRDNRWESSVVRLAAVGRQRERLAEGTRRGLIAQQIARTIAVLRCATSAHRAAYP